MNCVSRTPGLFKFNSNLCKSPPAGQSQASYLRGRHQLNSLARPLIYMTRGWMNRFRMLIILFLLMFVASACATPAVTNEVTPGATQTPTATRARRTVAPVADSPLKAPTMTPAAPGQAASPLPTLTPTPMAQRVAPVDGYRIVNTFPHDPNAFTQGLVFVDGRLYEGTGLRGRSLLLQVELESGQVERSWPLPPQYFGEGIAVLEDKVFQLTWQSGVGLVYDRETFEILEQFNYSTEGWGLTHDGEQLIMSDGTSTLYFLDPETLARTGQIEVRDGDLPVTRLNELEYIHGEIWANVWKTDWIARIDPATGQVTSWIDLSGLLDPQDVTQPVDVLNGIAYDADHDRIFVTGKLWPKLFEIEIVPIPGNQHGE